MVQRSKMQKIKLTRGKSAIIDAADYRKVSEHKWYTCPDMNTWYAMTEIKGKSVQLHRFLMQPKKDQEADHINGNGLDNRRCNLRFATHAENQHNSRKRKDGVTSKYKGVCRHAQHKNKFYVQIMVGNRKKFLGLFKCEVDAALAYDIAALKYFKEFARLNFPKGRS